jgi:shikimate kinase
MLYLNKYCTWYNILTFDYEPYIKQHFAFIQETLLAERKALYQEADLEIAVAKDENPAQIVSKILEKIPRVLKSSEKSTRPDSENPEDPNEFN